MLTQAEQNVYSDFLTNLAVAWFFAGVIAPFISPLGTGKLAIPLAAGVASWISLQLAIFMRKGKK